MQTIHIRTAVQVVVAHPLRDVLHVTFVRLQRPFHYSTLMKKIGQTSDIKWVEEIDLEEKSIANMVTVERYSFDQGDVRNVRRLSIVGVATIANG